MSKSILCNSIVDVCNVLDSNVEIILAAGESVISDVELKEYSPNFFLENVFDGEQFVISNLNNLSISGDPVNKSSIFARPRYANVITFKNCKNVKISNLTIGHTEDQGSCTGGVLAFEDCDDIYIDQCDLFGCGTEGLNILNTTQFVFKNSIIRDCTNHILICRHTDSVKIENCQLKNNGTYNLFDVQGSSNFVIANSKINNNWTYETQYSHYSLFQVSKPKIKVINTSIDHNIVGQIANDMSSIDFINCSVNDNEII